MRACSELLLAAAALLIPAAALPGVEIAAGGKPVAVIVLAPDAAPAERAAATELADAVEAVSGGRPAIVDAAPVEGPAIHVGRSDAVRRLLPEVDLDRLRPDELIVKSVGDNLILTGDAPRGTLYAVYDLLENDLGVRFWSTDYTYYPEMRDIAVTADRRDAPVFMLRDTDFWVTIRDKRFTATTRMNGDFGWCNMLPEEYGGGVCISGWCHTFNQLIPVDEFFESHPEWFSMQNGRRVGHHNAAQLCMTNPELQQKLAERLAERMRAKPEAKIFSLSLNDGGQVCDCPECGAINRREGSGSGSLLHGVNAVAELLHDEFPDRFLETIAYSNAVAPPAALRAHPNVVVRVCTMIANQAKPLAAQEFREHLAAWKRQCDRLLVWNYTANFIAPLVPHPNFANLGADLRLMAEAGVSGVFEETEQGWRTADFGDLRIWLYGKLLWNPFQDEWQLIGQFVDGYYGAAAPWVKRYIADREEVMREYGSLTLYNAGCGWVNFERLYSWYELIREAREAAAGDDAILGRLDDLEAGLLVAIVERPELNPISDGDRALERRAAVDFDAKRLRATELLSRPGNYNPTIWQAVHAQFARLKGGDDTRWLAKVGPKPEFCAGLGELDYLELSAANGNFYQAALCELVDDPEAAGGKAVMMDKVAVPWTLQIAVPPGSAEALWQIWISARVEPGADAWPPERGILAGSYYVPTGEQIFDFITVPKSEFDRPGYRWIKFGGPTQFSAGGYIYLHPHYVTDETRVYVDRLILVRQ